MEELPGEQEPSPKKPAPADLSSIFDLSGDKKIATYVQKFEELYRQRDAINSELKQLASDGSLDMLSKREVEACKKIAKWRLDDKLGGVQELLGALKRVSQAVQANLFEWADIKN